MQNFSSLGVDEIVHRATYHPPPKDSEVVEHHKDLTQALIEVAIRIDQLVPDCREKSLAMTKIEEARQWGNAGIARNHAAFG